MDKMHNTMSQNTNNLDFIILGTWVLSTFLLWPSYSLVLLSAKVMCDLIIFNSRKAQLFSWSFILIAFTLTLYVGSLADIMYMILVWSPFLIHKNDEYGESYILENIPKLDDSLKSANIPLSELGVFMRQILDINIPQTVQWSKYKRDGTICIDPAEDNLNTNEHNGEPDGDEKSDDDNGGDNHVALDNEVVADAGADDADVVRTLVEKIAEVVDEVIDNEFVDEAVADELVTNDEDAAVSNEAVVDVAVSNEPIADESVADAAISNEPVADEVNDEDNEDETVADEVNDEDNEDETDNEDEDEPNGNGDNDKPNGNGDDGHDDNDHDSSEPDNRNGDKDNGNGDTDGSNDGGNDKKDSGNNDSSSRPDNSQNHYGQMSHHSAETRFSDIRIPYKPLETTDYVFMEIIRRPEVSNGTFTRRDLINYIPELQERTNKFNSKTPEQSLSRMLQKYRDNGTLSFLGRGRYQLV